MGGLCLLVLRLPTLAPSVDSLLAHGCCASQIGKMKLWPRKSNSSLVTVQSLSSLAWQQASGTGKLGAPLNLGTGSCDTSPSLSQSRCPFFLTACGRCSILSSSSKLAAPSSSHSRWPVPHISSSSRAAACAPFSLLPTDQHLLPHGQRPVYGGCFFLFLTRHDKFSTPCFGYPNTN